MGPENALTYRQKKEESSKLKSRQTLSKYERQRTAENKKKALSLSVFFFSFPFSAEQTETTRTTDKQCEFQTKSRNHYCNQFAVINFLRDWTVWACAWMGAYKYAVTEVGPDRMTLQVLHVKWKSNQQKKKKR